MKILIADDDAQLARALAVTMSARGYEVVTAADGREAINAVIAAHPDVVLLDLGMPRIDGLGVLQALRAWTQVPVLVLSGRTDAGDKIEALDAGADDYVTKPFDMDELLARIRAVGRRRATTDDGRPTFRIGELTVDLAAKQVLPPTGPPIRLTPTEWRLLELLTANPGRLLTREMLLTDIWGPTHGTDVGYLRLYMSQLRRKLEPDPSRPRYLITEPGMGYRFTPDA